MEEQPPIQGDDLVDLPPGFRFHPTDEEIITNYVMEKVMNSNFTACAIGEADLNKNEPWDLPGKAKMGEKEWYFFFQKDRKYPTGMRTNRATESGYWKATGKDKEIYKGKGCLVGMKKTLVFYKGRAPKGVKTNWVMHEYRLEGQFSYFNFPNGAKDEWVVCRVFHKNTGIKKLPFPGLMRMNSVGDDDLFEISYLPSLVNTPYPDQNQEEFKGMGAVPSASYVHSDINQYQSNYLMPPNPNHKVNPEAAANPMFTQVPVSNPYYNCQGTMNPSYIKYQLPHTGMIRSACKEATRAGIEKQCKVEQMQFSNQSMITISQDTGISNDVNPEISSQHELGSSSKPYNDDLEGPSIGTTIPEMEYFWDFDDYQMQRI